MPWRGNLDKIAEDAKAALTELFGQKKSEWAFGSALTAGIIAGTAAGMIGTVTLPVWIALTLGAMGLAAVNCGPVP